MEQEAGGERKSKSQIKREMQALRDLGKRLVELPPASLERVSLDDRTRDAIIAARAMKREARRRQLSYIGGLLRREDAEQIEQTLERISRPHREQVRARHQIEQWRDRLLAGDNDVIDEIARRLPRFDRQRLRQLVRNAIREREQEKPPKSARLLYRYLAELHSASD